MNTSAAPAKAKLKYTPCEPLSLKAHPEFDETWLEKQIVEHPKILELGTTKVLRSQTVQKSGGRVDLLLKDEENEIFYTVELMLGAVDSSHIVRTIDYFLREQTRSLTEDWRHVAVLVAEDVRGSRFLEVVKYLSERMPLIVMELYALRIGDNFTMKCTRIFDGTAEQEAELEEQEEYTRDYWVKAASSASIELVDQLFLMMETLTTGIRPNYNKSHIGIAVGNRAENFVYFIPKQDFVRISARIANQSEWNKRLADAGFKLLDEGDRVRFRVTPQQLPAHGKLLAELFEQSYREWFQ